MTTASRLLSTPFAGIVASYLDGFLEYVASPLLRRCTSINDIALIYGGPSDTPSELDYWTELQGDGYRVRYVAWGRLRLIVYIACGTNAAPLGSST